MMLFDHVIKNADGLFYKGSVHGDGRDWTSEVREGFDGAWGYTEKGAYTKMIAFPIMFANCITEKRG